MALAPAFVVLIFIGNSLCCACSRVAKGPESEPIALTEQSAKEFAEEPVLLVGGAALGAILAGGAVFGTGALAAGGGYVAYNQLQEQEKHIEEAQARKVVAQKSGMKGTNAHDDDHVPKTLKLVPAKRIAEELRYATDKSNVPPCLQGILYMDQACTLKDRLPGVQCSFLPPKPSGREYNNGISDWDEKSRCFKFMIKGSWTIGSPLSASSCSLPQPKFCQSRHNSKKYGPCDVGAFFGGVGPFPYFQMRKTSWGWDRESGFPPLQTHYPLVQVVDGHGKPTQYFKAWLHEVTRTNCTYPAQCRKNVFAPDIAVCK